MFRLALAHAASAGATFQVVVDERFDSLAYVRTLADQMKKDLIDSDKTVVLEARSAPGNSTVTKDGFPVAMQRYYVAPLAFQDRLGQKVELILPVASVADEISCVPKQRNQCVDAVLENGPAVFEEVANDKNALAARLAILSDAFIRVRLSEDAQHTPISARDIDLDSKGPHRTWQNLAAGIQRVTRNWIQNGPPPVSHQIDDGAWCAGWWLNAGCLLAGIPLFGWLLCYTTQYFTRPKQIAAPLLGDLRLSEGDEIDAKFDGRQVTEYSHLTV